MQKYYVPHFSECITKKELLQLNPLVLAFIGDSVQTLFVRTKVSISLMHTTGKLHSLVTKEVKATSQSIAMKKILASLTEEEMAVYKRARNCKTNTCAKNASIIDYHIASGFEAIIGYLYLLKQSDRIQELMRIAYAEDSEPKD